MPTHALVRPPASSFAQAISSTNARIDVALAKAQHAEYCRALAEAGLAVESLPPDERYPDSCFIQDPAVVVAGRAIVGRMGVASRQGEEADVAEQLAKEFPLERITPPATLEGGDVMILPNRVLVGSSGRTNQAGIEQLRAILSPLGIPVSPVPVVGYLHLLTAATFIGGSTLLAAHDYAEHPAFAEMDVIAVPRDESYAANALAIGDHVILPTGYPQTAAALRSRGFNVLPVPMSEFAKADGGVTCLSLVW